MGHGAPVKHSSIPISHVVAIGAAEGLLYQAQRDLSAVLARVLKGSEDPQDWVDLDKYRIQVSNYTQQYTRAIYQMNSGQEKG